MAMYRDEALDTYLYSSYNPYSYRCPKSRNWRQKSYFSAFGEGEGYLDNYHRSQLRSILSQINPNLTLRLRKANTRDVAVQVNPRADASIQCSLGPRTLLRARMRRPDGQTPGSQTPGSPTPAGSGPGAVWFPRTQAVYSPIAGRGLAAFLQKDEEEKRQGGTGEKEKKVVGESKESSEQDENKLSPEKSIEGIEQTGVLDDPSKCETEGSGQEESDAKNKGRVRFQVRCLVSSDYDLTPSPLKIMPF